MSDLNSNEPTKSKVAGSTTNVVNYKWHGPALLSEGFVPFPKRLLRSMDALWPGDRSIQQLAVILAIADYRRPGIRPPSAGLLAFEAGLSLEVFDERLKELADVGLLEVGGNRDELAVSLKPLVDSVTEHTSSAD